MFAFDSIQHVTHSTMDYSPSLPFSDHEPSLWKAVITQALMDAASNSNKDDAGKAKRDAIAWLLSDSPDFEYVCDNAGLDPSYVRRKVREALARECRWRLPVGEGWRAKARLQCMQTAGA
jgi:hypothetical protein